MNRLAQVLAAFGTIILVTLAPAQSTPIQGKGENLSPCEVEIAFADGSSMRMLLLEPKLELVTRYGKLSIPTAEISRIEFGLHYPDGVEQRIDAALKALDSGKFKEREAGQGELVSLGPYSYSTLCRVAKDESASLEQRRRVKSALERIEGTLPKKQLRTQELDVLVTTAFKVTGRITSSRIKVRTAYFGENALSLADLHCLRLIGAKNAEFAIDAQRFGSPPGQWFDTDIDLHEKDELLIVAKGEVDLYPQTPGQYMSTPKGHNSNVRGNAGIAGALVGRVGENGKVFEIGERYEGIPGQGRLYLHIVPSTWNNASLGSYQVNVKQCR